MRVSPREIVNIGLRPTLFALCLASSVAAAAVGSPASIEVPLRPYFGDLPTVPVVINGDTLTFMLDTGGGGTIVTPETARKAGCVPFGQFTGFRHNGERISCPRCAKVELIVGGLPFSREAGVLDLTLLGMQGIDGILSLQSFEGTAITIDLGGNRLILEDSSTLSTRIAPMRELTVRPGRQSGGAALDMFVNVQARTGDLWLEIDSGNLQSVLLSPHAVKQLGLELAIDSIAPVTLNIPGLGPTRLDATARETIYDGLLNSKFFMQHTVTFDLHNMRAWASARVE